MSPMKVQFGVRSVTRHQSATVMPRVRGLSVSICTLNLAAREEVWLDQIGDNGGVMERRALGAVFFHIEAFEEVGPSGDHIAHMGAHVAKARDMGGRCQGLMGDIQRHDCEGEACGEDDVGRLRVYVDVEFRGRGDVAAFKEAAAHEDDFGDGGFDVGRAGSGRFAILVSGPRGQSVMLAAGAARQVSMIQSTACCSCRGMVGSASCGPSRPVLPWTCSAVTRGRSSGASQPAKTSVSGFPASSQTMRAFFWVSGRGTFPATAVMPSTLSFGGGQRKQDGYGVVLARVGVDDDIARGHGEPVF